MQVTIKISISITHEEEIDVEETCALEEVFKGIREGYTQAKNANEDESFIFSIETVTEGEKDAQ